MQLRKPMLIPAYPGYVVGLILLLIINSLGLQAQSSPNVHQLFAFNCVTKGPTIVSCPSGGEPSRLIQSADGNFYGTTSIGGTGNLAAGTVFKLTPSGQLTTLHTFIADQSGNYPNGANPGGVVEGNDGFLYGATVTGGANNTGVVFQLSKAGAFHVVRARGGVSYLTFAGDGNLYGYGSDASGNISLVRITPSGSYSVLHTLTLSTTGIYAAGLILGSDGNLYGTTIDAEIKKITSLFRLTTAGQFTVLQTVHYGQFLVSAPIQSANGNLYAGLDFVVQPNGSLLPGLLEHNLYGAGFQLITLPYGVEQWVGEFLEASDGNFWGLRGAGSLGGQGAIVSFTHSGAQLQQINLGGYGLMQASDGRIVGLNGNEIFALEPALPAPRPLFVSPSPASGKVGAQVMIHGSHFVGTTAVTFNGVSASFRVLNTGNIVATVPAGATTGPVEVTNAGGVSLGGKSFTVD
jgi:uncharacterized repeat protein (TIGR03803 family)